MDETDSLENGLLKMLHREPPPFWDLLGIEVLDVKHGYSKLQMSYDVKLTNPYGLINGGFMGVLADTALACALLGMTEDTPTRRFVSIEFKVNNIRPVSEGFVIAEAKVVHLGKKIAVGEVEIRDQAEVLVSKALLTWAVKY